MLPYNPVFTAFSLNSFCVTNALRPFTYTYISFRKYRAIFPLHALSFVAQPDDGMDNKAQKKSKSYHQS